MGQERFNGLAVLNIHKEIPVNISEVIDIFSWTSRKMKLDDWSNEYVIQLFFIVLITFNFLLVIYLNFNIKLEYIM